MSQAVERTRAVYLHARMELANAVSALEELEKDESIETVERKRDALQAIIGCCDVLKATAVAYAAGLGYAKRERREEDYRRR